MRPQKSSSIVFRNKPKQAIKFQNGMYVRYTGHLHARLSRHELAKLPVVPGGTYTVAHSEDDGSHVWLYLQELPGLRCAADGFVPIPHLAEDHWHAVEFVPAEA